MINRIPQKIDVSHCAEASLNINRQLHVAIEKSLSRNEVKDEMPWDAGDLPFLEYFLLLQSEGHELTKEFESRLAWEPKRIDFDYQISNQPMSALPSYLCPFNIRTLKEKLSQLVSVFDVDSPFPYIHYASQFIDLLFASFRHSLSSYFYQRPYVDGSAVVEYDPYKTYALDRNDIPLFYRAYNFNRLAKNFIIDLLKYGVTDTLLNEHSNFFILSYPSSLLFLQGYIWEKEHLLVSSMECRLLSYPKDLKKFMSIIGDKEIPELTLHEFIFYKKVASLTERIKINQEFNNLSKKCLKNELKYHLKSVEVGPRPKVSIAYVAKETLLSIIRSKKTYLYQTKKGAVEIDPSFSIENFLVNPISVWEDANYLVKKMFVNTNVSLQTVWELDLDLFFKKCTSDRGIGGLLEEFKQTLLYIVFIYYFLAYEEETDSLRQYSLVDKPRYERNCALLDFVVYILFSFEILSKKGISKEVKSMVVKNHKELENNTLIDLKKLSKKIWGQLNTFDKRLIVGTTSDLKKVELLLKKFKDVEDECDSEGDPLFTIGISKGEGSSFFNEKLVISALYQKRKFKDSNKASDDDQSFRSKYYPKEVTKVIKSHIKDHIGTGKMDFFLSVEVLEKLSVTNERTSTKSYIKDRLRDMKKILDLLCSFKSPKIHQFSGGYSQYQFRFYSDMKVESLFDLDWGLEN